MKNLLHGKIGFVFLTAFFLIQLSLVQAQTLKVNAGNDISICQGNAPSLTATVTGGLAPYRYTWTGNGAPVRGNNMITVRPTVTTTYIVNVSDNSAPRQTASDTVIVKVSTPPQITAGPTTSVCPGTSATLTAAGGVRYSWNNQANTQQITVSPTITTTYRVTGFDNSNCSNTANVVVSIFKVNITPTGNVGICNNTPVNLTANSTGNTYSWSTGATSATITVNPTANTTYLVTATGATNCTASSSVTVSVVQASAGPDVSICQGTRATLSASGGTIYRWSNGGFGANINVRPTVTTTYTVSVSSNFGGCTSTDEAVVNILTPPQITAGPSTTVCPGTNVNLTAAGGISYSWNTGANTQQITVAPIVPTTYTVTGVNNSGCSNTANVFINISPLANAGPDVAVCKDSSVLLTGSGAGAGGSYQWTSTGVISNPNISNPIVSTRNPNATQDLAIPFYLQVTSKSGCQSVDTVVITFQAKCTLKAIPSLNPNVICAGGTSVLSATAIQGTAPYNYRWNLRQYVGAGPFNVAPRATTTYTVTVTDATGASNSSSIVLTVNAVPRVNAGPNVGICSLAPVNLTATGNGINYKWSTGDSTTTITVNPTVNTTYQVTTSNAINCSASSQVVVSIIKANAGNDVSICQGGRTTLTASGGTVYQWSNNRMGAQNMVIPITTTTYTVSVSNNFGGCTSTDEVVVNILTPPVIIAGTSTTVCAGTSVNLTAVGGVKYSWSTKDSVNNITIAPITTTTYIVTGFDNSNCTNTANVIVTISPLANAGPDVAVCKDSSVQLTGSGVGTDGSFHWTTTTGIISNPNISNPIVSTNNSNATQDLPIPFYLQVTSKSGCQSSDTVIVTFQAKCTLKAVLNLSKSITCGGDSSILSATGIQGTAPYTYQWNNRRRFVGAGPFIVAPGATTTYTVTVTDATGATNSNSIVLTVNPAPTVNLLPGRNVGICDNTPVNIEATGTGTSYSWSTGATTAIITVNPAINTTYTVTATNLNNCSAVNSAVVSVVKANAGNDVSICQGARTTLSASGGTIYRWSNGGFGANINVNPTVTTTYTVSVSGNNGGCTSTDQVVVRIVQQPTVNVSASVTICNGDNTALTATGGTSYKWSTGDTTSSINVKPTTTTFYTVTANPNGCSASDYLVVTVSPSPTISAGNNVTICQGATASLTATGGVSYSWNTGATTATVSVSPTTTTTYSVTGLGVNNCKASNQVIVTVNPVPTANAGNDVSICKGNSASLTVTGVGSYQWNTGATTATISVTPQVTTTYSVTVTNNLNCSKSDEVVVNIIQSVIANAGPDLTIAQGNSTTLQGSASGGSSPYTFAWTPVSNLTNPNIAKPSASPMVSTVYSLSVKDANGCLSTDQMNLIVQGIPGVNAGADTTICKNNSVQLNAIGFGGTAPYTYSWIPVNTVSNSSIGNPIASPTSTTTYTIKLTDANGNTATDELTITVNSTNASAGQNVSVCSGSSANLTATGGVIYQWNTGDNTSQISVTPILKTTYTVTVTGSNGCTASSNVAVSINNPPVANAGGNQSVCDGSSITLTATGGSTYSWSNNSTGASINVQPTTQTTFTVTATDINGCTASNQAIVSINNLPVANAGGNQSVCAGNSITLTATGGINYAWSNNSTGAIITVQPTTQTTFTVTATDINGCSASDIAVVSIVSSTVANAGSNVTICNGDIAPLSASGGTMYLWSTGDMMQAINVEPTITTTYTVTVNPFGCSASSSVIVTVNPAPTIFVGNDATICQGLSVSLTARGGVSYNWNTGAIDSILIVSPSITTTYTATVIGTNGCAASDQVVVTVNPAPVANAGSNNFTCKNYSIQLNGSGAGIGGTYHWTSTGGIMDNPNIANPTVKTDDVNATSDKSFVYTLEVTTNKGCTSKDSVTIIFDATCTLRVLATATSEVICSGNSTSLSATAKNGIAPYTFNWDNNLGTGTGPFTVNPLVTTTYQVTVTDNLGAKDTSSIVVTVNPLPTVNTQNVSMCEGSGTTLNAENGATYEWSTGEITQSIFVNPAQTTTYTVIVTDNNGCKASAPDNVIVSVHYPPVLNMAKDTTVCADQSIDLNAGSGYNLYSWQIGNNNPFIGSSLLTIDSTGIGIGSAYVFIGVVDNNNCFGADTVKVTFDSCVFVGIKQLNSSNVNIKIYPNPSSGKFNLSVDGLKDAADLSIFNMQGQVIYKHQIPGDSIQQIDISDFASGIYFVKLMNKDIQKIEKVIIQ